MTEPIAVPQSAATESAQPATPSGSDLPGGAVQEAGAEPAVETPAWRREIEQANIDELRQHPRIAGLVGEMVDKTMHRWRAQQQAEMSRSAAQQAEAELMDMAVKDPAAFARRFLSDKESDRFQDQLATIRLEARQEIAGHIGKAVERLTDGQAFTADEYARLNKAIADKSGDGEVISAYTAEVTSILADRRAAKKFQQELNTRLEQERKAIRTEEAAKLLKQEPRPDMARPAAPARFDPSNLTDAEFTSWYEKQVLARI